MIPIPSNFGFTKVSSIVGLLGNAILGTLTDVATDNYLLVTIICGYLEICDHKKLKYNYISPELTKLFKYQNKLMCGKCIVHEHFEHKNEYIFYFCGTFVCYECENIKHCDINVIDDGIGHKCLYGPKKYTKLNDVDYPFTQFAEVNWYMNNKYPQFATEDGCCGCSVTKKYKLIEFRCKHK